MRETISFKTEDILNILDDLEQIVVSLDKIGSGYKDTDTCSSAIHLFMLEEKVLDKLSFMRRKLSDNFSESEIDDYYEREIDYYNPDYSKEKEKLVSNIKELLGKVK